MLTKGRRPRPSPSNDLSLHHLRGTLALLLLGVLGGLLVGFGGILRWKHRRNQLGQRKMYLVSLQEISGTFGGLVHRVGGKVPCVYPHACGGIQNDSHTYLEHRLHRLIKKSRCTSPKNKGAQVQKKERFGLTA